MNRKFYYFFAFIASELVLISTNCSHDKDYSQDKESKIIIPVVSTDSVTQVTSTSAIMYGTIVSKGNGTCDFGFCSSDINPIPTHCSSSAWIENNITSDNYSYSNIAYLTPGLNYFVRAYALNEAGTAYGNVISFSVPGSLTGDINFNPNLTYESLYDIDRNSYKTIKIGNQTWMAENLKTKKYNDGTDITLIDGTDITLINGPLARLPIPYYCWCLNDENKYKNTYGALYNWYCVNTGKLCPEGWHIPSILELKTVINFLGGDSIAWAKLKETGSSHWFESSYATNLAGTNSSGFTALPGGNVNTVTDFSGIGSEFELWTSTEYSDLARGLVGAYAMSIYKTSKACYIEVRDRIDGFSVRCIKD